MKKRMPRNGGTTIRMRRYNPLESALVPLGNTGVTPPAVNLTAVDIDAVISFYGQYVKLNEQVTLQNQDPALNEAANRSGVSLRQTEDELTRNMLAGTAAFRNCLYGFNGDNPTELTRADVQAVVRDLLGANAKVILDNLRGENRIGTGPVRSAYYGLCHTALSSELENCLGFIHKNNYPNPRDAHLSEWGTINNIRFFLSTIGSITTAGALLGSDVYNIFCVGREAYACIEQDGYSAQFIYRPPIYDGPLALNASVGWKMAQVPRITNDEWVINLRCTLS